MRIFFKRIFFSLLKILRPSVADANNFLSRSCVLAFARRVSGLDVFSSGKSVLEGI